jgi:hypothetical protein
MIFLTATTRLQDSRISCRDLAPQGLEPRFKSDKLIFFKQPQQDYKIAGFRVETLPRKVSNHDLKSDDLIV